MQRAILTALGYPHADDASTWSDEKIRRLIVWLENTKVL
jgi:hypothetical protein